MGILLMIIALAVLGFGLSQHLKGKRILAAPFRKTGEIAKDPTSSDPKGAMSTEGAVLAPQPLQSPCSKTPCLYYEVEIVREWEKQEQTQDGVKTRSGSSNVETLKQGMMFKLDDGSGPLDIDATKGADFDNIKRNFDEKVKIGAFVPGELVFGQLRMQTPSLPSSERTTAFKAIEKIVPVGGNLFALGKLENGALVKPGWRSMMFSTKGRDGLLASTAKKKKFSFIGGGVAAVASIPLMIFAPAGTSDGCQSELAGVVSTCKDNVDSENTYSWKVEKDATYHVLVTPPEGKAFPFIPEVKVTDEKGEVLAEEVGGVGQPTTVSFAAKPGAYRISVKPSDGKVSGGYDYSMSIAGDGLEAAPAKAADALAQGNPALCADGEVITGVRTCKATLLNEDGTGFELEIEKAGKYTINVLPVGAKSVKHPMLTVMDESGDNPATQDAVGSLSYTRSFKAGRHIISVTDLEVGQDEFPVDFALSIAQAPAGAGKSVAAAPKAKAKPQAKKSGKKK
ncbi:MAG: GIDE domain-containing protein [Myxococcaceae bacterium]